MDRIKIFTDGSCLGNPGPGGWAFIVLDSDIENIMSGSENNTTNNRMELKAIIEGLKSLERQKKVSIYTDSMYVMNAFVKKWIDKWISNGWKTSNKSCVKNKDLWQSLLNLSSKFEIDWQWVKAHSDNKYNNRVDIIARQAALDIENHV